RSKKGRQPGHGQELQKWKNGNSRCCNARDAKADPETKARGAPRIALAIGFLSLPGDRLKPSLRLIGICEPLRRLCFLDAVKKAERIVPLAMDEEEARRINHHRFGGCGKSGHDNCRFYGCCPPVPIKRRDHSHCGDRDSPECKTFEKERARRESGKFQKIASQ